MMIVFVLLVLLLQNSLTAEASHHYSCQTRRIHDDNASEATGMMKRHMTEGHGVSKKINIIRAAAMLMSFWVSMMSAGCSGGSRYALQSAIGLEGWENATSPRGPQGVEEETVCQAANSREVAINGDTTAILLSAAPSRQIVVAIAGPANHDEMTPKRITYYLVVNGKIAAHSNPVLEPSPDIDYEKTVFKAAVTSTVIIYSRPTRNLTVKGSYKNECIANVRVLNGFDTTGEVLSDRIVNICFDN